MEGWWRWALVSLDGVAPSQMVGVSASVNLPLHHKCRSSVMAPAYPSGLGKRAVKWLWCGTVEVCLHSTTPHHNRFTAFFWDQPHA